MSRLSRRAFLRRLVATGSGVLAANLPSACAPVAAPMQPAAPASAVRAATAPAPTVTPARPTPVPRPEIIRMYPDAPSTVVRARHAGVWDDMPLAAYVEPPLTTVRQDLAEVGRVAVSLLSEAGEDPGASRQVTITPALVVRQSTAPPRQP